MNIQVTQEHINKGNPNSSKGCPLGLAIKETLPKGTTYNVGWDVIEGVHLDGTYSFAMVDQVIAKFMYDFADGKEVSPFRHSIFFMV